MDSGSVKQWALKQQSPAFWHQGPVSWKTVFPQSRGGGGDGSDGNTSDGSGSKTDGEQRGAADEALLAPPPLTSCCVAGFLTGTGPRPGGWGPLP